MTDGIPREFPTFPFIMPWDLWNLIKERQDQGLLPTNEDIANQTQFFVFSPFVSQVDSQLEMALIVLLALKLAKTPEGLKVLKDLGTEYLRTLSKIMVALEDSSTSNWLTALINQKLSLRVFRRMGLITATEAGSLEGSYNWIFGITIAKEGIVEGLQSLGSFAKGLSPLVTAFK